jgi:cell surface protein SprA
LNTRILNIVFSFAFVAGAVGWISTVKGNSVDFVRSFHTFISPPDTTKPTNPRRPTYTPPDRQGDPLNNPSRSNFELNDPDNVQREVELDTATGNYVIKEKMGNMDYRPETYMTFEEFYRYKNQQMIQEYWRQKSATQTSDKAKAKQTGPTSLKIHTPGLGNVFGSDYVDIRPNGLVTLDFKAIWQRVNNPQLPIRQQRVGNFDFDQQISMNLIGKIGEKLKITVNWDTKAAFEFQNNIKVQYTAFEEDIIQAIEVGRVSMPLNSSLMTGPQNLFGFKTKLQFGRMSVTSVIARQDGKVDELKISGGGQGRNFEIKGDLYEDYKHFFLSQYFRDRYEANLANLPFVNSPYRISRVEVYVTNRNNTTVNTRNVVGYMDLGENATDLYRPQFVNPVVSATTPSDNAANTLYQQVETFRTEQSINSNLQTLGLENGTDYTFLKSARKLNANEFTFNEQLGYISLQTRLRNDEALLVSYEYTLNGDVTPKKVGETSEDYQNQGSDSLVVLKMLKPPSVKTRLPTWDLMMKNIYQLGTTNLVRDNFQFRIIYKDDITGADLPTLQEGNRTKDVPLLQICGLDSLNPQNDPAPDGNFDYLEGITIDSKNGRIIFPVLEPFGSTMDKMFDATEQELKNKYVFFELYDSTQSDAQQIASKNKYFFKGRYNAGTANEIVLPGINIAPKSVTVIAGSITLVEGTDYTVDYNLGRIKILNEAVLSSGQEIRIRFEKQDLFNFRRKSFMGTRFDYKVNKDMIFGGTILHSNEAPNITRVNIGDEPAANTIVGLDAAIRKDSRVLTRIVDALPIVETKAPSNINFQGEYAHFIPGYNKIVDRNGGDGGTAFIDDFEGARTPYDLTRSPIKWRISSTPVRFAEHTSDTLNYMYRRAKMAWYNIDNVFYRPNNGLPNYLSFENIANHYERNVTQRELYPNQDPNIAVTNIVTLDLAYYPSERGPYNYNPTMTNTGNLTAPTQNWAGITREIRSDIDFDNANIQYVEFWLLSPYINTNPAFAHTAIDGVPFDNTNNGKLYINLGSISEDVMKDGKQAFENGLPVNPAQIPTNTDETAWGRVTNQQFLTDAFDNTSGAREAQDIGLDGLNNADELNKFVGYVTAVNASVLDPVARDRMLNDISTDNFSFYLGDEQDQNQLTILQRYKNYNGLENNSPVNSGSSVTPANSNLPDNEDLNADNALNTVDEYYEYEIDIDPTQFRVGDNYIVSARPTTIQFEDGSPPEDVVWYQFRVPIRTPDNVVGNINGFKSIKFIRMYVTGFKSPVVLRMAQLQLVANQWRVYQPDDINEKGAGVVLEPDPSIIEVSTVNIEENGTTDGNSTPYVLPPDFNRDFDATSTVNRRINEQSLRLCIQDIKDGSARAVFKNTNLNLINYENIEMFIHAETTQNIADGKAVAFIRLGTDYKDNYYEIEVPLFFTSPINTTDPNAVWRSENTIKIPIDVLINTKLERNAAGGNLTNVFRRTYEGKNIIVVGNPDMSSVVTIMLGIKNPIDDKVPMSLCIWTNELRATGYVTKSSYAYAAKLNLKLADFANVNSSIRYTSAGFGNLDQKTSQRERNNTLEYGFNTTINLDKFIPPKVGLKLPMYLGYNKKIISPEYDPLNPDVDIKKSINAADDPNTYRDLILDQTTTRAINFTNIQKIKTRADAKKHFYDVENLTLSLGYSEIKRTSYEIKEYYFKNYKGSLGYTFSKTGKSYQPFKNMEESKNPFQQFIKETNFTLFPSQLIFKTDLDRRLTKTQYFQSGPLTPAQRALFEKSFNFNRTYGMMWNFTKSITIDYKANAYAIVDEPNRAPGDQAYKDSLMSNLMRLGRLKNYDQMVGFTYKMPFDKVKSLNWLSGDYRYTGSMVWTSGALRQRDTLGNLLTNKRDNTLNGKIDLDKLYAKSKFLSAINNPKPPVKNGPAVKPDPSDTTKPKPENKALKTALRTMMMVKSVNGSYTVAEGTQVGGFTPIPKAFGIQDPEAINTMLPFVLGSQDPNFRLKAAQEGMIATSKSLNTPFTQAYSQTITLRANIEPTKDLKIQLDAKRTNVSSYSELYRIDSSGTEYVSNNPLRNGNYSASFISILSTFDSKAGGSLDPNSSQNWERFKSYRTEILERYGNANLDEKSQDVLIPAFIAAYSGKDPSKVALNSFPKVPLPNWRIDYNGLSKVGPFKKNFQSITLSHAYTSTYRVGSYTSSLKYGPDLIRPGTGFLDPGIGDSLNNFGTIVPLYVINEVAIQEAFSPLIGINARTKNKITYRFEYKRIRNLSLGLNNGQMREDLSREYVFGIGMARKDVKIPKFLTGGQSKFLKNELNIRFDLTIRDQVTFQRKLDENTTITAGNLNFQLKPSITYNITQRVIMMVYFERTINDPRLSSSFRRSTTAFGVQIRFTLS